MNTYRLITAATFAAGVLGLTDAQARPRAHCLTRRGEHYEITAPVQFKAGEVIGFSGEMPRGIAHLLADSAPLEKPARRAKGKK